MSNDLPGLGPDKVVMITAGAAGIGRCLAEAFLSCGCRLHICDNDADALAEFVASSPAVNGSCVDVSEPQSVAVAFADLAAGHGRLDVLINNVGIAGPTARVEDVTLEEWERTLAVDLNSAFYCTRLGVPMLKQDGGLILNMASNAALLGCPLRSPYVAAKWALNGLTKTWAMELGHYGIRVNALCPGSVNGARIDAVIERDASERGVDAQEIRRMYARQSSMQVFVEAQDVANSALFLASDMGRLISGQAIGVDGHTESLSVAGL